MKQINGVTNTQVGYANGNVENPTYKMVCTNTTGFAETVMVEYDERQVDLRFLISLFFQMIDPTSLNKQGEDEGTQYRTGVYFVDDNDEKTVRSAIAELSKGYAAPVVVEIEKLRNFYEAEDYHQDYLDKNPDGYCHVSKALFDMARKAKKTSL